MKLHAEQNTETFYFASMLVLLILHRIFQSSRWKIAWVEGGGGGGVRMLLYLFRYFWQWMFMLIFVLSTTILWARARAPCLTHAKYSRRHFCKIKIFKSFWRKERQKDRGKRWIRKWPCANTLTHLNKHVDIESNRQLDIHTNGWARERERERGEHSKDHTRTSFAILKATPSIANWISSCIWYTIAYIRSQCHTLYNTHVCRSSWFYIIVICCGAVALFFWPKINKVVE